MRRLSLLLALLVLFMLAASSQGATFIVNNAGDQSDAAPGNGTCATAGAVCTLRAAIEETNALGGANTITFASAYSIVAAADYVVTNALTIDGTSVFVGPNPGLKVTGATFILGAGANGSTIEGIRITGSAGNGINIGADNIQILSNYVGAVLAGDTPNIHGVFVSSGNNIQIGGCGAGNILSGNSGKGIEIGGGSNISIFANRVGTDATGAADPNGGGGIGLYNTNIAFVGMGPCGANYISGNGSFGIEVGNSTNTTIQFDRIGVNDTGTAAIPNAAGGIHLLAGAGPVKIGGNFNSEYNVISGNFGPGIEVEDLAAGVSILGNRIGTDETGAAALFNLNEGVRIFADGVVVGDTTTNGRNIIVAAASQSCINVNSSADSTFIRGNYIGTEISGSATITSSTEGVFNSGTNTHIGGTTPGQGNVMDGHATAIATFGTGAVIEGNHIGVNAAGNGAIGNNAAGIVVVSGDARIGGAAAGSGNLISGIGGDAVTVNPGVSGVVIQGNAIGVDVSGTLPITNFGDGIDFSGSNGTIAGNILSANSGSGINVEAVANTVLITGNIVGLGAAGNAVANTQDGIAVSGQNVTIGGATAAERNVISANASSGIRTDPGSTGVILGNFIGTDLTGTIALGNVGNGINVRSTIVVGPSNVISGNLGIGVSVNANNVSVNNNEIGTNAAGTAALGNGAGGVNVQAGALNTSIFNNVISGNVSSGVIVQPTASGTSIKGNRIGTNAAGSAAISNTGAGIDQSGTLTTIGGPLVADRNVISGNQHAGIAVTANATTVQNNYIGTDLSGTVGIGNQDAGVSCAGSNLLLVSNVISGNLLFGAGLSGSLATVKGNLIGLNAAGTASIGNASSGIISTGTSDVIGGSTAADRNVVSGNGNDGITLFGVGDAVTGNYIGTTATGLAPIANAQNGVHVGAGASSVTIGSGNVISGNTAAGVLVDAALLTNQIQQNTIGLGADGTTAIANGWGIRIHAGPTTTVQVLTNLIASNLNDGLEMVNAIAPVVTGNTIRNNGANGILLSPATNATIGGSSVGAPNIITANTGAGVRVSGASSGDKITRNSIFNNGGLGIDLEPIGVTPNDSQDPDSGPNTLQNFPVIISAITPLAITGTLNSTPTSNFTIEFFSSLAGDPEGRTFVGTTNVTTDASGNAAFTFTPAPPLTAGEVVTATATNSGNNTSEFSAAALIATPGVLSLSSATYSVNENAGTVTITVNRTGGSGGIVTVNYATSNGTAGASDYTTTNGTLTFGDGIITQSFTVPILNDTITEPSETFNVTISAPTGGATLGAPTTAVVTILDDDPGVDLSILKTAPATVVSSSPLNYSILVSNAGPAAATNVTVTDVLPAGTTFVSATPTQGSCVGTTTVTCSLGTIANGASASISLQVTSPSTAGPVSNTATVTSAETDLNPANNTSTATATTALPGTLALSSATYSVNENAGTVTITVNRTGGSGGTVTVNYATSNGTAGATDYTTTSGTLTFANGVTTQSFTVPILNDAVTEPSETFNVTISAPTGGATLGAPTTAVVTITDDDAGVDLGITKTGPASVNTSSPVAYSIVVSNAGPAPATSVAVTDVLPAGTTFVSVTPTQGTCAGTTTVTCSLGTIASGSTATIALTITSPSTAGPFSNTATVSSAETDANAANNTSTATTSIAPPIPALSPLALLMLGMALALAGAFVMRR